MQPLPQPVSERDSGSLIAEIEARATDRRAGIFGPQSISWQVNRESALFLGAGRAALLQLAHPWVATALEQHSSLMSNPFARFHSTFRTVFTMIFGTVEQATAAAHHLYHVHTFIEGNLQEDVASYRSGSHYRANEIAALRWVYATLVESAVLAYETVLPPLSPDQLDAYYAESQTMAALFGIPAHALPSSWTEFLAYCRTMEQSSELGVTSAARAMAQGLLSGAGSWIRPPRWYHALTTQWLAPRLQADFGLSLQPAGRRSLERAQRWLPASTPACPASCASSAPGTKPNPACPSPSRAPSPASAIASGSASPCFRFSKAPRPNRKSNFRVIPCLLESSYIQLDHLDTA